MAYIDWDYTLITSMVEKQGWDLPERESEEWNKFNDELGEKMRGVGLVFEKYFFSLFFLLLLRQSIENLYII